MPVTPDLVASDLSYTQSTSRPSRTTQPAQIGMPPISHGTTNANPVSATPPNPMAAERSIVLETTDHEKVSVRIPPDKTVLVLRGADQQPADASHMATLDNVLFAWPRTKVKGLTASDTGKRQAFYGSQSQRPGSGNKVDLAVEFNVTSQDSLGTCRIRDVLKNEYLVATFRDAPVSTSPRQESVVPDLAKPSASDVTQPTALKRPYSPPVVSGTSRQVQPRLGTTFTTIQTYPVLLIQQPNTTDGAPAASINHMFQAMLLNASDLMHATLKETADHIGYMAGIQMQASLTILPPQTDPAYPQAVEQAAAALADRFNHAGSMLFAAGDLSNTAPPQQQQLVLQRMAGRAVAGDPNSQPYLLLLDSRSGMSNQFAGLYALNSALSEIARQNTQPDGRQVLSGYVPLAPLPSGDTTQGGALANIGYVARNLLINSEKRAVDENAARLRPLCPVTFDGTSLAGFNDIQSKASQAALIAFYNTEQVSSVRNTGADTLSAPVQFALALQNRQMDTDSFMSIEKHARPPLVSSLVSGLFTTLEGTSQFKHKLGPFLQSLHVQKNDSYLQEPMNSSEWKDRIALLHQVKNPDHLKRLLAHVRELIFCGMTDRSAKNYGSAVRTFLTAIEDETKIATISTFIGLPQTRRRRFLDSLNFLQPQRNTLECFIERAIDTAPDIFLDRTSPRDPLNQQTLQNFCSWQPHHIPHPNQRNLERTLGTWMRHIECMANNTHGGPIQWALLPSGAWKTQNEAACKALWPHATDPACLSDKALIASDFLQIFRTSAHLRAFANAYEARVVRSCLDNWVTWRSNQLQNSSQSTANVETYFCTSDGDAWQTNLTLYQRHLSNELQKTLHAKKSLQDFRNWLIQRSTIQ